MAIRDSIANMAQRLLGHLSDHQRRVDKGQ